MAAEGDGVMRSAIGGKDGAGVTRLLMGGSGLAGVILSEIGGKACAVVTLGAGGGGRLICGFFLNDSGLATPNVSPLEVRIMDAFIDTSS